MHGTHLGPKRGGTERRGRRLRIWQDQPPDLGLLGPRGSGLGQDQRTILGLRRQGPRVQARRVHVLHRERRHHRRPGGVDRHEPRSVGVWAGGWLAPVE